MTLTELDFYLNSFLQKENFTADPSRNGIQISNSDPNKKDISCVAFAVDACEDTVNMASEAGAQVLFVHHGIFWGDCEPLTGIHYNRISLFLQKDIALYASHLPLDANSVIGNNYGLARAIGLTNLQPFGLWRGMTLGVYGEFKQSVTIENLSKMLPWSKTNQTRIFPFGPKTIKTVGIISGGAGEDFVQAVSLGLDAYITGEVEHQSFHPIKENKINVLAGGHYNTETIGVNLVRRKLEIEKNIKTVFLDAPTGL